MIKKIKEYLIENWLALVIIGLISFSWAQKYQTELYTPTDVGLAGQKYATSQYVMGDASPEKVKDSTVYIYAASRYVAGENPTKINFDGLCSG